MKAFPTDLKFTQVLPSSIFLLVLGGGAFLLYPTWTWFADLGVIAIIYGVVLGLFMYGLSFFMTCSPRFMTPAMISVLRNLRVMFMNFTWPQIIVISILAGLGEEMLMRGLIQVYLQTLVSPVFAVFIASLIFGLMHFMSLAYVMLTFVGGLILGLAFYLSNSLLLVVIAHAVYDVCAFAMIVKYPHKLGLDSSNENLMRISG